MPRQTVMFVAINTKTAGAQRVTVRQVRFHASLWDSKPLLLGAMSVRQSRLSALAPQAQGRGQPGPSLRNGQLNQYLRIA
jgi:hypothetical protein